MDALYYYILFKIAQAIQDSILKNILIKTRRTRRFWSYINQNSNRDNQMSNYDDRNFFYTIRIFWFVHFQVEIFVSIFLSYLSMEECGADCSKIYQSSNRGGPYINGPPCSSRLVRCIFQWMTLERSGNEESTKRKQRCKGGSSHEQGGSVDRKGRGRDERIKDRR